MSKTVEETKEVRLNVSSNGEASTPSSGDPIPGGSAGSEVTTQNATVGTTVTVLRVKKCEQAKNSYAGSLNRNLWRQSYDAAKLAKTSARDLLEDCGTLGLRETDALTVSECAWHIMGQRNAEACRSIIQDLMEALEGGNEEAHIHALWLADIWADWVAQQLIANQNHAA